MRSMGLVRKVVILAVWIQDSPASGGLLAIRCRTDIGLINTRCCRLRLRRVRYPVGAERIMLDRHERDAVEVGLVIDRHE